MEQTIIDLVNKTHSPDEHKVTWDGIDNNGNQSSSGSIRMRVSMS